MHSRWAVAALLIGSLHESGQLGTQDRDPVLTVQVVSAADLEAYSVSRSLGDVREPLGTAGPTSPLRLNMNNINFGKGQRVDVNVQGSELILIGQGTTDRRCEMAGRDNTPPCREVAVLTWGESTMLGVSSTAGVIDVITRLPGTLNRSPFRVGVDVTAFNYHKLDDVACDMTTIPGLTGCDTESSGMAIGANLEYQLGDRFSIGVGYNRSKYSVDQDYGGAPVRHEVTVGAFDLYGRMHFRPGATVRPWGILGMSYYDNEDELYSGDEPLGNNGQGGPRILYGAGLDIGVARKIDLRVRAVMGGGAERDADTRWGIGAGLGYNF